MELFWLAVLALALAVYLVLGGYDLGVGILSGCTRKSGVRDDMAASIAPLWDGNGTWLVVAGTVLFGAFPAAYSILLSALYVPLAAMLAGLVLRGVAIEFRGNAESTRPVWDLAFCVGSLLAAFMQGVAVGTYAQGIPVEALRYAGDGFEWLSRFPLGCGAAMVIGYALLGAAWLTLKGGAELQTFARAAVRSLAPLVLVAALLVFGTTLSAHEAVEARWATFPELLILPGAAALALVFAFLASRDRWRQPFGYVVAASVLLLLTLAVSYVPWLVPFSVTLEDAASPRSSQQFMFWGAGLFVLPLVVLYTWTTYMVFRGKVSREDAYH